LKRFVWADLGLKTLKSRHQLLTQIIHEIVQGTPIATLAIALRAVAPAESSTCPLPLGRLIARLMNTTEISCPVAAFAVD
jgi:hypothetical protein